MALFDKLKKVFSKNPEQAQPTAQPAQAAQPAPVVQPAAVPQPVPAPAPRPAQPQVTGRDICSALDTVAQKIIAMNFEDSSRQEVVQMLGQSLQDVGREYIDETPCTYEGFDALIVTTIREFPNLCKGCRPRELEQMLSSLSAAIQARTIPDNGTSQHSYFMQSHYYTLKLIELQGRMITNRSLLMDIDNQIKEMKASDNMADETALPIVRMQRKNVDAMLEQIDSEITACKLNLKDAQRKMDANEPMGHVSLTEILKKIAAENEKFARMRSEWLRELNDQSVEVSALLEDERERHALEEAARESIRSLHKAQAKVQAELGLMDAEEAEEEQTAQPAAQQAEEPAFTPAAPKYTETIDVDYDYVFSGMTM